MCIKFQGGVRQEQVEHAGSSIMSYSTYLRQGEACRFVYRGSERKGNKAVELVLSSKIQAYFKYYINICECFMSQLMVFNVPSFLSPEGTSRFQKKTVVIAVGHNNKTADS